MAVHAEAEMAPAQQIVGQILAYELVVQREFHHALSKALAHLGQATQWNEAALGIGTAFKKQAVPVGVPPLHTGGDGLRVFAFGNSLICPEFRRIINLQPLAPDLVILFPPPPPQGRRSPASLPGFSCPLQEERPNMDVGARPRATHADRLACEAARGDLAQECLGDFASSHRANRGLFRASRLFTRSKLKSRFLLRALGDSEAIQSRKHTGPTPTSSAISRTERCCREGRPATESKRRGKRDGACDQRARRALYVVTASPCGCDRLAANLRVLRSCFFLLTLPTICSMDRTVSGRSFLKRWKYSSWINSGKGNFQGSCLVLARLPSFFGFSPNSLAIWMWASERWKRRRASIQGRYFSGIFFFFAMGCLFSGSYPMLLKGPLYAM